MECLHFFGIDLSEPVVCCGEIFKESSLSNFAIYHNKIFIICLFYGTFIASAICAYFKKPLAFGVINTGFLFVAIYAIIRFFSPYIYELPLHKCPFCLLDSGYYFVGYLIYVLLYLGAIGGIFALVSVILGEKFNPFWYKISLLFNLANVALLSSYVAIYFIKNGVML